MSSRIFWSKGSPKLLLAEDDPPLRRLLSRFLAQCGYRVSAAADRHSAEDLIRATELPIVVTDLELTGPGALDGLELIALARRLRPETVAVLMTGAMSDEVRRLAGDLGVDALLTKPVELDRLRLLLLELCGYGLGKADATSSQP